MRMPNIKKIKPVSMGIYDGMFRGSPLAFPMFACMLAVARMMTGNVSNDMIAMVMITPPNTTEKSCE